MEEIISFLTSPELIPSPFGEILGALKIIFLAVSLALIVFIVFILLKSSYLKSFFFEDTKEFLQFKTHGASKLVKEWKKINKKLESELESEYKLAVIEADVLLDEVLSRMGHTEETIEEKLKATTSAELYNIEEVKKARKTRNGIVYDPDYSLTLDKAKETLKVYEEAFKNLNVFS